MAEFRVIQDYFLGELMPEYVSIGPGDDCAVFSVREGHEMCVSTDTLLEAVHFPVGATAEVVAHRSIAANLSDLAAMGAKPHGMTIALTLPDLDEAWLGAFAETSKRLAQHFNAPIVGGNLAKGPRSITITVMGIVPTGLAITRAGASVGDDIYVSGDLGAAAAAVAQLGNSPSKELLEKYECPEPQLALGHALLGIATSAIDISDGLLADLGHILAASHQGAQVDLSAIPVAEILRSQYADAEALNFALNGGDDYQICFTAAPTNHNQVVSISAEIQARVSKIGVITEAPGEILDQSGRALLAMGYQHFEQR